MCNSQGSSWLQVQNRNEKASFTWRQNILAHSVCVNITRIHQHTKAHAGTRFIARPHRPRPKIPFISSYWQLLYPLVWWDHTRQHLPSSVFLQHPPSPSSPLPYLLHAPLTWFLCLPFISFHLSSLLNSTTGIRVWRFDGCGRSST